MQDVTIFLSMFQEQNCYIFRCYSLFLRSVTFCVFNLLRFTLHFVSKVVTFRVNVTLLQTVLVFALVVTYRRNIGVTARVMIY